MTNHSLVPEGLKKVPTFPPVAARLLTLLAQPDVDLSEVTELVSSDAALTVRLLQYVNSAACGAGHVIADIRESVAFLGFDRTRQLVAVNATAHYAAAARGNAELQSCWQHSLATAVLADEIAKSCRAFTKTVFTAGILHDIGRLGLIVAYPQQYTQALRKANGAWLDLLDFEREQFGIDHAEAGRILTEFWGLPQEFPVIAGRHHDSCEGVELSLLRIVHVGCQLANTLGFYVVPPAIERDVQAILSTLPAGAGNGLEGTVEELRIKILDRIEKLTGTTQRMPPKLPLERSKLSA